MGTITCIYLSVALAQFENNMSTHSVTGKEEETESQWICDQNSQASEMLRLTVEFEEEIDGAIRRVPQDLGQVDPSVEPSEKLNALGTLPEVEAEMRAEARSESLLNLGFLRIAARISKVLDDDPTQIVTERMQSILISVNNIFEYATRRQTYVRLAKLLEQYRH